MDTQIKEMDIRIPYIKFNSFAAAVMIYIFFTKVSVGTHHLQRQLHHFRRGRVGGAN